MMASSNRQATQREVSVSKITNEFLLEKRASPRRATPYVNGVGQDGPAESRCFTRHEDPSAVVCCIECMFMGFFADFDP